MKKLIASIKSYRTILKARNRDRLWNKLTKGEQLELTIMKLDGIL